MIRMEVEKMSPDYFQLILDQLSTIENDQVQQEGQLQVLKMDVGILKLLCSCLETWDDTADEQSKERLRSVIAPLTVIWPKEHRLLSLLKRLAETRPIDIHDLHSANLELEAKIGKSKQLFKGWCENLLVHSSLQCNSSTYLKMWFFTYHLENIMKEFSSYRAAKIVPFKKQIDILKAKIVFLNKMLTDVTRPNSKEFLEVMAFVHAFATSAARLTCLYWAKEANEETATEMNIVLFNMLQKFIPSAPDIIPLHIGILKLYNSSLLGEAVDNLIDFFFDHLATTLKDDFLILRNQLIFIFTFLINPPCENAGEEDLIRTQIYALFRQDAYLIMPFDEMNEDFLDKKMLLSDCMIKIEIASAKIRQLYCGFSDSWIRLEVEKMDYIYFVTVQRELFSIEKHAQWADLVLDQVQLYIMELRFLRMFLLCFATWDDTNEEIRVRLSSMITSLQGIWIWGKEEEKGILDVRLHAKLTGDITDWHLLALELQGKIQLSKLEIEAWCVNLIHWSFQCKASTGNKILDFLDSILHNLKDLVSYKAGEIVPFKKQIETLEEKLVFLHNMLKLTANCIYSKELGEFHKFVQVFANDAACLTFQYWAKEANADIATQTNLMLSHMLRKIKPTTPDVARLYFGTLKSVYLQRSDSVLFGQTVLSFVDLFLEDLATPLKDEYQILQDDIIFLLTFLNEPPNANAEELICNQIDVLFWEGVYDIVPFDDIEGDFSKKKVHLSDFMMRIETVNANIRQLFCKFPDSSLYNFPKVISPWFLDFLIQNLRNLKAKMISDRKYVPFAKYKIITIEKELVSLRPFFNHIFDLQSELNETWLQVVNLLHLTEHVISSCISSWFVFDNPIWYHMAYLSDVFDKIRTLNTKLEKIKENMYNARCFPRSVGSISTHSEQARTSKINEVMVGFEDESEKIIGMLTWGNTSLDIVSIVGMGGLGKTTLAKKIYGSSLVKCNFNVFSFSCVSEDHNTRKLLLDIIGDIMGVDDRISKMTNDDLAHQLWKCLSRQKYLIVLDDIWNVSAWNEVKSSFPDDKNGSRIMFTTRSREVANKCKINCIPHQLRFLSEVESWELLQKKVFEGGIAPTKLCQIGKVIANNCKGLPLAIVVIAGVLAGTDKSPSSWSEIAERMGSYLSDEGCMNILELSYTHLPEYLKPCLLYLGAFPEDGLIRVKQVVLLWIAEGFIQESETKSLEDIANEYFRDLVDRSLVIVSARSSSGEIKKIRVHDLIHDMCQAKCRDGKFFHPRHGSASCSSSDTSLYNHYRVSTQKQSDINYDSGPSSLSNTRSLLFFSEVGNTQTRSLILKELKLAQVLHLEGRWMENHIEELSSLVNVRHIEAAVLGLLSIPSSISNFWNMQSLIITSIHFQFEIDMPETFWRMKSLRHVKVTKCKLTFSDGHEHEAYPQLDKVVSFSSPILSSGKDVEQLLQRLPAVRELSCILHKSLDSDEEPSKTLDFYRKLESLKLRQIRQKSPYLINFPSTLKKLRLEWFQLPWTAISAIAELHCLRVLKLQENSFPGPRWEMEDVTFPSLEFFELYDSELVQWDASTESFPCLEQLLIRCKKLEELPPCFGEISTLKRVVVRYSAKAESSALRVQEEHMELGNEVDVTIYNASNIE